MRLFLTLTLFPLSLAGPAAAQRKVDERRPVKPDAFIRIWNLAGAVRVAGWEKDTVAVTGTVAAGEKFLFGGTRAGVKLGVEVPMQEEGKAKGSFLEVRVPARSQVWIKSASADITVEGFAGGLDAYSVSGKIRIAGNPREINAESMGGDIEIFGVTPSLRAKSASGSITVNGGGSDATIATVSGSLTLLGGHFQRGRFESIDGGIRYEGPIEKGASLEFLGHSGTIELVLPAKTSSEFAISTFQGEVQNEFGPAKLVTARDLKGKELNFTLGTFNGAHVSVRNFKGKVVVRRMER